MNLRIFEDTERKSRLILIIIIQLLIGYQSTTRTTGTHLEHNQNAMATAMKSASSVENYDKSWIVQLGSTRPIQTITDEQQRPNNIQITKD